MRENICLIGLDEPEIDELKSRLDAHVIAHPTLPRFRVHAGSFFVDSESGAYLTQVDRVVFHGIFEDDFDLLVGLCLWGGPCFPPPRGMLDCRNKHACLVRALSQTQFPGHGRGFVPQGVEMETDSEYVAKWGNWHCGENKSRFQGRWKAEFSSTIEPYFPGQAVRVALVGNDVMQIRLDGTDWRKSIHHDAADFMDVDPQLEADTRALAEYFGLELLANDYIVAESGEKYLLEVNHIPNVTRFPEMWKRYVDAVVDWCQG